jgi:hypothetical protein
MDPDRCGGGGGGIPGEVVDDVGENEFGTTPEELVREWFWPGEGSGGV